MSDGVKRARERKVAGRTDEAGERRSRAQAELSVTNVVFKV